MVFVEMLRNSRSSIASSNRKSGENRCLRCHDCNCSSSRRSNTTVGSNSGFCVNAYPTRVEIRQKNISSSCSKKPFNPYACVTGNGNKQYVAPALQPTKINQRIPLTVPVRNLDTGSKRDYKIVRQDEELYQKENAANGDEIRISRHEFDKLVERARRFSASTFEEQQRERNCTELSYPQINSTRKNANQLHEAVKNLGNLPKQISFKVRTDEKYKKQVDDAVTKKLNIPFKSKIYNDLVTVESAEAERIKSVEEVKKALASNLPIPKDRDEEPDILAFNKPTFSRIKPKLPGPPPPLVQDVSTDADMDLEIIGIRNRAWAEVTSNESLRPPFTLK